MGEFCTFCTESKHSDTSNLNVSTVHGTKKVLYGYEPSELLLASANIVAETERNSKSVHTHSFRVRDGSRATSKSPWAVSDCWSIAVKKCFGERVRVVVKESPDVRASSAETLVQKSSQSPECTK